MKRLQSDLFSADIQPVLETLPWADALAQIQEHGSVGRPLLWELVERFIAVCALMLTAPVMAIVAILIRLDSPGPALFRQYRVGRGGRLFRFTKFRTYYSDAKERFPELYDYSISAAKLDDYRFKIPDDPRATRVGAWLRKSTLDELPNFWHVLTGDMSLVGPRPEIPELLPLYTEEELRKFSVKPGVTGLSQVSGRGWLTLPQTKYYDLRYVEQQSVWLDVRVMALTLWRVVLRHGAF
jgi:lipopolysaccharide/colanic/teichoic acid biosynthesis glycosyltransferase